MANKLFTFKPDPDVVAKSLRELSRNLHRRGLTAGLSAVANPMTKTMRTLVSIDKGSLRKSIGRKQLKQSELRKYRLKPGKAIFVGPIKKVVEPRRGGKPIFQAYKARWIEFGVAPHSTAKGARLDRGKGQDKGPQHPGFQAKPFIEPAYRQHGNKADDYFIGGIDKFLDKWGNA